jgi:hypothetical protein
MPAPTLEEAICCLHGSRPAVGAGEDVAAGEAQRWRQYGGMNVHDVSATTNCVKGRRMDSYIRAAGA